MKTVRVMVLLLCLVPLSNCVSGLNRMQKDELVAYKAKGLKVEEKKEGLAAGLGFLPGVGSFYTGNVGYGIVNLLSWPLSILWEPVSGYNGAQQANYNATKVSVAKKRKKSMRDLEKKLEDNEISQRKYLSKKREIEDEYSVH